MHGPCANGQVWCSWPSCARACQLRHSWSWTDMYIHTYMHYKNRSFIQSLTLMHSAIMGGFQILSCMLPCQRLPLIPDHIFWRWMHFTFMLCPHFVKNQLSWETTPKGWSVWKRFYCPFSCKEETMNTLASSPTFWSDLELNRNKAVVPRDGPALK